MAVLRHSNRTINWSKTDNKDRAKKAALAREFLAIGMVSLFCWETMNGVICFARYWLPVVVWMLIIFSGSSDALSVQHTSRILGPLIQWFFPSMPQEKVAVVIFCIRKCAHAFEFAVLALLMWRALVKPSKTNRPAWRWADARLAFFLTSAYAVSDELHQRFVASRQGAVRDVLIDVAGAAGALLLLWLLSRKDGCAKKNHNLCGLC